MAYFDAFGVGNYRMSLDDQVSEETGKNGTKIKPTGRIGSRKTDT